MTKYSTMQNEHQHRTIKQELCIQTFTVEKTLVGCLHANFILIVTEFIMIIRAALTV